MVITVYMPPSMPRFPILCCAVRRDEPLDHTMQLASTSSASLSLSSDAQTSFRSFVARARGFLLLVLSALPSAKLFVGAANLFSDCGGGSGSAAGAQGAQSAGAPQKASVLNRGTNEAAVSTLQDISASWRNAMRAVVTFFRDRRFFFAGSPRFFVQQGAL